MLFYWSVNAQDAPLPRSLEHLAGLGMQVWGLGLHLSRGDPPLCREWQDSALLLLRIAVGSVGRLLGPGEAEAAHPGVRETPAARSRRGDGEANAAVRQPASIAPIQPRELPGGVEVPDLGYDSSAPPASRVGFGQR